jgi:hypothetical protein
MVKGNLTLALDGRGIGPATRRKISVLVGAQWYVYDEGPSYSNAFAITEWDDAGLAWLKAHQEERQAREQAEDGQGGARNEKKSL